MKKNYNATTTNVAISNEIHQLLVEMTTKTGFKVGKFAEIAIKEKIERELKPATSAS
jgi:hypothetical protein